MATSGDTTATSDTSPVPATTPAELTAGSRGVIISPLESLVSSALDNAIPRLVSAISFAMRQETGSPSAPSTLPTAIVLLQVRLK